MSAPAPRRSARLAAKAAPAAPQPCAASCCRSWQPAAARAAGGAGAAAPEPVWVEVEKQRADARKAFEEKVTAYYTAMTPEQRSAERSKQDAAVTTAQRLQAEIKALFWSKATKEKRRTVANRIIAEIDELWYVANERIDAASAPLFISDAARYMDGFIGTYSDGREYKWQYEGEQDIDSSISYLLDAADSIKFFIKEYQPRHPALTQN